MKKGILLLLLLFVFAAAILLLINLSGGSRAETPSSSAAASSATASPAADAAVSTAATEAATKRPIWSPAYRPPSAATQTTPPYDPCTTAAKPVIYLYPTVPTEVRVTLTLDGTLGTTWPVYEDGWTVAAQPDGTLTDAAGEPYSYLFWDGSLNTGHDFSEGFCVAGADTAAFLRDTLSALGLTPREYNEMIVYWLPQMQNNAYNLISFQYETYTDAARLHIEPAPDSLLRVFMAWQALDEPVEIPPQTLTGFERHGFTVVEWGGGTCGAATRARQ